MNFKNLSGTTAVGQLVVWNGGDLLQKHIETIADTLAKSAAQWFMNIVSIGDGSSYFISSSSHVESWAGRVLDVTFEDNVARAGKLWLRKEIVKQDLSM